MLYASQNVVTIETIEMEEFVDVRITNAFHNDKKVHLIVNLLKGEMGSR